MGRHAPRARLGRSAAPAGAFTYLDALFPVLSADRLHAALPVAQAKVGCGRLQQARGVDLAQQGPA